MGDVQVSVMSASRALRQWPSLLPLTCEVVIAEVYLPQSKRRVSVVFSLFSALPQALPAVCPQSSPPFVLASENIGFPQGQSLS